MFVSHGFESSGDMISGFYSSCLRGCSVFMVKFCAWQSSWWWSPLSVWVPPWRLMNGVSVGCWP